MKVEQAKIWDKEYGSNSKLITRSKKPQAFIKRLFKFLKKRGVDFSTYNILDLGTGIGRNLIYFSQFGASGIGLDISDVAISEAKELCKEKKKVEFRVANIGEVLDLKSETFDLVIDATSSNALSVKQREKYLSEVKRVLKDGGYFFVRALCKDGDKNAKKLIQNFPGIEHDTYIMPEVGLVERVFSREDFMKTYSDFEIVELKKESGYSKIAKQSYKRNFWICIMRKK
jgi:SAM-dependent methyltransferase